jgi:hypothetical protein
MAATQAKNPAITLRILMPLETGAVPIIWSTSRTRDYRS